ncbi:MAG: hypothetical protein J6W04_04300 [Bacteroidales bacterium]|nr:hypothetical protein [Bacteroidales bacterium]
MEQFIINGEMTNEGIADAILKAFGLNIKIHPTFVDDFVTYIIDDYCQAYNEDDNAIVGYDINDADSVKWFAELLTGKQMPKNDKFDIRKLNKKYFDGDYKVIGYRLYGTLYYRLVLIEDYIIETI